MKVNLDIIHEASMKILKETGMKFHHPEVLKMIEQKGVRVSGKTAFFTKNQIMEWIKKAPGDFTVYARNPKYNMRIGGDHTEYVPGYGSPAIVDIHGVKRLALYCDYINFLKIVHQSDYFKMNGGILVQPADLRAVNSYPVMLYSTVTHSDKCILGGPGGDRETRMVMDMLGIIFGGKDNLIEKPRIMTIISTLSPLQIDKDTLDTLMIYARHGQPVIISPTPMAGTTAPVTLAGAIALANSEALAGIAVTQIINEGTPVMYGFQTTTADMKTGSIAMGSPERALCIAYGARLAKFYGIPSRGGGTDNDALCVSVQSGYESMMTMLVTCQEKVNLIIHSAGIIAGFAAMSYEQFIVDLEIIGMINRFIKGVQINEETLALDVIKKVGPGGEFITSPHTLKYCRNEPWTPEISIRGTLEDKDPAESLFFNIKKKKEKLLSAYRKPEFPADVHSELISYLNGKGFDLNMATLQQR